MLQLQVTWYFVAKKVYYSCLDFLQNANKTNKMDLPIYNEVPFLSIQRERILLQNHWQLARLNLLSDDHHQKLKVYLQYINCF